jgi:gliding motility-associated-like protein
MKYFKSYFIFCLFIFPGFLSGQSLDASFSSSDVDQCPGSLFTVKANNLSYSSYNWLVKGPNNYSFNSTNNSSSISLILSTSGNYSVTLTVGNGVTTNKSDQPNYLTVYSRPVVSYVLTPTSGCVPLQVDFNGSCSAAAGTISSFFITTGTGSSSDKEDFKFTFSEVGSYTPSATVTNSFGCFTTQNLSTITVNPLPSLSSSTSPPAICSGETFSYTPTSATVGCTFSWSRAAVTGISQTASSGTGNISEVLTNTSSSNITVIYSVVTTDPNGCKRTQNVSIVVKAKPVISIDSPSLLVCPGQTGTLTASAVPSGGLFTWANGLGTNQSITVSAAGTYTVGYSLSNCAADSKSAVVTIGTTPTVSTSLKESSGVTNDDGTICPGGTVTLTATPSALGGTYLWQPGGETTQTINVSPSTTTTYSVVYTLNCPSASSSRMVTVSPGTVNNYTSSVTNACGFPVTTIFNSTATALGGATIASTQWSFPGGTPSSASGSGPISVTYNSSGAYAVTMTTTSSNNCVRTNTFNPAIVVGTGVNVTSKFEASVTTVCADEPFTFKYTGSGADSIKWELGDGKVIWSSDDKSITYTYVSPGNYTVSMTPHSVVGGYLACIGSISKFDVTVLGPKADFSVSNVVCSNQFTRTFKQLSRGTTPSTTYEWEFPGGTPATSTAATQTVTWANEGSYSVKLKATDLTTGCFEKEKTVTINVNKNTGADFQVTLSGVPTTNICLGTTLTFTNTTPTPQNNSGTAPGSLTSTKTQWDWNTNDGVSFVNASVGTPQTRSFTTANGYAPGSYGISMRNIDNNNCENIITKSNFIRINGVVATISAPASLCIGQTFSPTHSGSLAAIASTRWDFGDGNSSTSNTPTHSYSVPGDYKVTLTLVDTSSIKCTTTVVHNVIVRNPKASFTINNNYICSSQKLAVTNTSTGVGLSYFWTATNGSPSSSKNASPGTFSFPQGNQTVKLAVTDDIGCKDSITIPISVFDLIVSATPSGTSFPCFNPPNVVSFKNTSSNNVNKNSARWDFGNGKKSTSWEPSAIYSERGTYLVKLTVSSNSGCSSTIDVATINVGGASGSIDVANSVLTGCSCYEVSFDVSSSNADESVLLFGDGAFKTLDPNTTQKVSYSYCNSSSDPVTYIPSIFVKNNTCNGIIEAIDTIKINPNPVITGESALCVGATIKLTATGTPAATNSWVSSNTAVATVSATGTVTGVASGTTTITFTDINGCSTSKTITVNANPTISGETSICKDLTLLLTGSGIAATTNPWKSSSLSVATINNSGLVTGVSAGTSTITYTNNNGCFVNQSITVNATPTISNAKAICEKETLQLTGSATASTTNPWTSSNTTVATVSTLGLLSGVSAGTTTITYTNSNGCSISTSITVNALPTITGNVVLCPNTTSQLTGSPTPATTNPWVSANTSIATITSSGLVTAKAFGTSVITYKNSLGCSNTLTVSVSDPINPIFNQVPAICSGGTLSALPTSSTNSVNGTWSPSLNNTATTTYTFTPTAGQCANTATMTITVNPLPTITGVAAVCEKATLQLTGNGTAATTNPWVSSNSAVATVSNSGLVTGVSAGTTTITYTNNNGCLKTESITVNALPTITGNTVLCLNTTSQLTGSPTAATTNPWVSANTTIATISNTGLVTARAFGTSVITYQNSLGCSNAATINVSSPVTPTFNQVPAICSGEPLTALPTTSNNSVNGTWSPALNKTATTTYTFTPSAGQCANTTTMTITVNPLPTISGGTSVCEKATLQLTGNGTAATTNPWISSNTNVATISNSGLLTSLSAGTTIITYTNNNGCSNTTTITVNSPVTPTFTQVSAICSGASLSALPTTSSNSVPGTWTPAINNTATTTYTFTPNSGECANAAAMTITVNSNPTILGGTSVCIGNKLEFVGSGTPATSNPWISSNTSSATVSNTGLVTGISAGTSIVTYSDVNGCKATRSVTVNSNPTISGGDKPICNDVTLQLTGSVTAATINPWVSSNTSVATISNSGLVTALSDGTTTITYSNSNACSVTKSITVNSLPTINGGESVCKDATLQLTGTATAATTNPWVSSKTAVATISNTGLVTGVTAGTTTITYTNNNGCSTTASITVNALPTITGNTVLCLNTISQLTGSPTAATSNPWISANTSIATITSEGLVAAKAKGTSLITYRNSIGCSNTVTVTVTDPINPSFASVPAICNGSALSTLPTKSTNDVNGTWSPALNNVATTTYTFTPTAGQCANSATLTITVNPLPTISGDAPVCAKATLQLTGSATAATPNPWTSSSTAVATVSNSGLVTGVSAGTTTITYTNNNGCSTTASITVNALPTITGNLVLCPNTTSQLTGSPTQAISNPWVSANTSIATITGEGLVTAKAFGTSVITYRNDQGCSNTSTINVTNPVTPTFTQVSAICSGGTLSALPTTSNNSVNGTWLPALNNTATTTYTFTPTTGQCANSANMTITVNPLPTITGGTEVCEKATLQLTGNGTAATTNPWVSSNTAVATVSNTGLVTGVIAGTSTITYTNNNGCSNTTTITVNSPVTPTFTQVSAICSEASLSALPTTSNNSINGTWTPAINNTATITYTFTPNSGECANAANMTITVNPLPTISGGSSVCLNSKLQLTGSGTAATTSPWTLSNPAVATISNTGIVVGLSGGTTTITYTNNIGCSRTLTINVNPLPDISGNSTLCQNKTSQLIGTNTAATTNPWSSANTSVATINNSGLVNGISFGKSLITYTNSLGCTDTMTVNVTQPINSTFTQVSAICLGGSLTALPTTSNNSVNGTWLPALNNTATTTYTFTPNSDQCANTATMTITVNPLPTITGGAEVCEKATLQLTGNGTAATTTPWVSSNTSVATVSNSGLVTSVSAGTTTITYSNNNGCSRTSSITVNALPTITGNVVLCPNTTSQLSGSGTPASSNPWVSANTSIATITSSGFVTAKAFGTSVVTFRNSIGCANTDTINVTNPITPTFIQVSAICSGATMNALPTTSNNDVKGTWSPSLNNTATTTYTFTPNSGQCANTTIMTITVNSLPTITGGTSVCKDATLQLNGNGTAATTTPWVSSNTSVATISSTGLIAGLSEGITTITYTNNNGCSNTSSITVNVLPTITGNVVLCLNTDSQLSGSGTPASSNPWNSSNTTIATITSGGLVSAKAFGKSLITYKNNLGCVDTITVTVTDPITPTFTQVPAICFGGALSDLPTTSTNNVSGTWLPALNNTATTTYTFTPTAGQCANTATMAITVNQLPTIGAGTSVCEKATLQLTGSPTAATSNAWNSSNTAAATIISNTGLVTGVSTGITTITYTNNNGCATTREITVNSPVTPTFIQVSDICSGANLAALPTSSTNGISGTWSPARNNTTTATYTFTPSAGQCATTALMTITVNSLPTISGVTTVCKDATLQLTGNGTAATSSPWTSSSTSVATVSELGLVVGLSAGSATITYTNDNGCSRTSTIAVNPLPTITGGTEVCEKATLQLTGSPTAATSNAWNSGNTAAATISNTGLVTGILAGNSTITYKNNNGCATTREITVNSPVTPIFAQVSDICSGDKLNPLPTSSTNSINGTWSPALNNAATTTYTFTPSAGQCANTTTMTIMVNPLPTISGGTSVCKDAIIQLTGSGTAATPTPWTSSNTTVATISNSGLLTGVSAGTTTITYTNNIGCSRTSTITVNALPTITGNTVLCLNATSQLTGSPTAATTNTWVSASTEIATITSSGLVTARALGTSVITYNNSLGCSNTATINVTNPITPTFTQVSAICSGGTLSALPLTSNNSVNGTWSPALNNTATTKYTFTPNSGQCANTATMDIVVNPLPTITGNTSVCKDETLQLSGNEFPAITNPWTSSNTSVASVSNTGLVTGVTAGTATITYTNNIGCSRDLTITVNALPTISGTTLVCVNATSQLAGTVSPATLDPWVSSNTTVATISNAGLVSALAKGTSTITYKNSLGCSNTAIITVTDPITPTFNPVSAICSGANLTPLPTSSTNTTPINGTWLPAINNTATTTYTFTPGSGLCATQASLTITINPLPEITGEASVCKDASLQLIGNGTASASNPWKSSSASIATVSNNGLVTGVSAGSVTITYTNNNGCSIGRTITVNGLPKISGNTLICVNATSQLTGTTAAAPTNPWISTNTSVATVSSSGLVNGIAFGKSLITYRNSLGCSDTMTVNVTQPVNSTFTQVPAICSGGSLLALPITSNNSIKGTWLPAINNKATTTYTFTPTSGQCANTATMEIVVNPLPTITGGSSVCKDATIQLTGNGTAATTNPWVSSNTSFATISSTGLVTGVSAGSTKITYTNNIGCSRDTNIVVNALPTISGNKDLCLNTNLQLTGSGTVASSSAWVSASPSIATISNTGLITPIAIGTSVVTYQNSLGCLNTATINVIDPIIPTFTQVSAICSGANLTALPTSSTNSTPITGTWSPALNNKDTTTYTFTPNTEFCATKTTMIIAVNPLPTITDGTSVCEKANLQLTGNGAAATTNPWTSSNAAVAIVSNSGQITGLSAGSVIITYTNNNGCSIGRTITVNALPTITGNTVLCLNATSQLTGSPTAATTNPWVSSNTTVATITILGRVTARELGTSEITYRNNQGCSNTAIITVTDSIVPTFTQVSAICSGDDLSELPKTSTNSVGISGTWSPALNNKDTTTYTFTPNPELCATKTTMTIAVNPLPTITGGSSVCKDATLQLTGNGTAATTNPWVSGNTSFATISTTGLVTAVSAGTTKITYTNNNGCSRDTNIVVNALPTISGNKDLCLNTTLQLTGSGTAASSNAWVSASPSIATISNTGLITPIAIGTSVVTYQNSLGCSNTATINVIAPITPTFTQVSAICSGANLTALPDSSTNTTPIKGTWSPALNNTTTATYTFTPNSDECANTANMTITVNPLPTITGGSSVCKDAFLQLTGNGTAATTNPWVSSKTAVATISNTGLVTGVSADTTKITYTNSIGCSRDTNIVVNALPTISGIKDLCLNTTLQLTGSGTAAVSNAWVSASPSIATISDMGLVNPIAIGTSVVTYQNSLGCSNTATINVIAPITPTFTQVSAICSGANLTALPDSSTNTTPIKGTWSPALNNTTTATYTFTPNSDECANTANMTITVNPLPTITGGSSVCKDAFLQLTGNGTAATTNPWVSSKTAVATISNTGLVTGVSADTTKITYTNSIGCSRDTNIVVNALPTVNAGIDINLCSGDSIRLNGSFGGAATSIEWSGGLGRFNPNNKTKDAYYIPSASEILAGNVTLILTTNDPDGPCNAASDNLTITIQKGAVVDAGPIEQSICAGDNARLNGSFGGNATGIVWSGGSGNFSNKVSPTATYGPSPLEIAAGKVTLYLTTDDPPGICGNVKDSVVIKINALPDVEAGLDTFLCLGQCLLLNAKSNSMNVPVTFDWNNDGIQGSSFCPTNTSVKMVVTATDAFNCKNKDSLLISFSNAKPPVVSAGPDTTICFGEQLTLFGRGEPNVTYTWNNGVIDSKPFKPTKTDTYIVTGKSNLTRCFSIDSMLLTINPSPDVKITTPDSVLCIADTAFLLATGALNYQWLNGGPPSDYYSFIPDKTAKYFVVGFNQFGCADTASITVSVNPYPIPRFESDMKFGGCLPFSPTFKDITGRNGLGPESDSVIWDFGNGLVSFQEGSTTANYDAYGCYNVTLTSISAPGCESSLTIENVVCVNEITASFNPDPSVQLVSNPYFKFVNKSKNATAFEWDFGDTTDLSLLTHPEHGYQYIGEYVVRLVASAQDGCTDTAYRKVKVKDDLVFNIPNTFTPDGDNLNEIFSPMLLAGFNKYVGYSFGIYNRWGKEVFFTNTPGQGWDGFSDGKIVPAGIYLWKIRLKSSVNNESFIYTGHVNVLR